MADHASDNPFAPLVGQVQAVQLLTQAIGQQRIAPAYLFVGPEGVGRRLAATCFIELICSSALPDPSKWGILQQRLHQGNHPDVLWVQPTYQIQGKSVSLTQALAEGLKPKTTPQIRLSQVREIAQFLSRSPLEAPRNFVVMEQAETMAEAAGNGLLKTLEEPGQATLILLAPNLDALLPTLISRCQRIPFSPLTPEDLAQVIHRAGYAQLLDRSPQHLTLLEMAQGSPGQAIEAWQQLQNLPPDLLSMAQTFPQTPQTALTLARQIAQQLDLDQQVWLLNYLQRHCWQPHISMNRSRIQSLEQAKHLLRRSVQSRLVWETTLLQALEKC